MLGKPPSGKRPPMSDDTATTAAGNASLLYEIETLSRALSLDPKFCRRALPPSGDPKPKSTTSSSSKKEKKSSLWNWKPLKALSHIRQRRFECLFSLHVHSVENLPSTLVGAALSVQWKRTTDPPSAVACTSSVQAFDGMAEFEETLTYRCSVYGARRSSNHSAAKYESRHFLIYASVSDSPLLDLGKHLVDLTSLLPLTLEELENAENCSGKWSTSFRLVGKGKGASLNVSFEFSLIGDRSSESSSEKKLLDSLNLNMVDEGTVGRGRSKGGRWVRSQSVDDVRVLHEVLPTSKSDASSFAGAVEKMDFTKSEDRELCDLEVNSKPEPHDCHEDDDYVKKKTHALPEHDKGHDQNELEEPGFMVIEQGVEIAAKDQLCALIFERIDDAPDQGSEVVCKEVEDGCDVNCDYKENILLSQENPAAVEDQDLISGVLLVSEPEGLGGQHSDTMTPNQNTHTQVRSKYRNESEQGKPFSFDVNCDYKENVLLSQDNPAAVEDQDLVSGVLLVSEPEGLGGQHFETMTPNQRTHTQVRSKYRNESEQGKPFSFDDTTEAFASEFLSMLGIDCSPFGLSSESHPESPRERLWKQFEEEALGAGSFLFGLDTESEFDDGAWKEQNLLEGSENFDLSPMVHEAERELHKATQDLCHSSRAQLLEDAETEALMRKWGLDEGAFQCPLPRSSGGFGSPIDLPTEVLPKLPPLCEGLGPFVQTKDGGFLRSMSPSLFRNSKNNASLIMQVSSPVVVPAEMGSGIIEILQGLASVGIEKLSVQAKKLMPLEDVTGKTMQQIAWEGTSALDASKRAALLPHMNLEADAVISQRASGRKKKKNDENLNLASSSAHEIDSEYVSVEDLAPLAMDKIEALSMEGLRIQSGMAGEEAPSSISSPSFGNMSALQGKGSDNDGLLGLEDTAGLRLLDVKDKGDDVDGLMSLSITLDEWMRLDSGMVDDGEQVSDRTSKILAAHHASFSSLNTGDLKQERDKRCGRRWGLLGSNFTVALMVQLRDPLRNYEPVGTPMLALIQVERVFVPPKPKIYTTISEKGNSEDGDEPEPETKTEPLVSEERKEEENEAVPQFKISEVHVAGMKTELNKRKVWGNPMQQQSGSRWLLASGMGKSNKHPFMKSKSVSKPSPVAATVQPEDALWSISSHAHGTGSKWNELLAINPHIRNPNITFPKEIRRLH